MLGTIHLPLFLGPRLVPPIPPLPLSFYPLLGYCGGGLCFLFYLITEMFEEGKTLTKRVLSLLGGKKGAWG